MVVYILVGLLLLGFVAWLLSMLHRDHPVETDEHSEPHGFGGLVRNDWYKEKK